MDLLHIVHLEPNDADAVLVGQELRNAQIECELFRARNLPEMEAALCRRPVDIILADRHGDVDNGLSALASARDKRPDLPFIFLSRSDDGHAASEALQAGATDVISKDHLPRLVPSIQRVMQERSTQRDLRRVRRELIRHARLLDLAHDAIVISNASGKITFWNRGAARMYGWTREEATGRDVHTLLQTGPPEQLARVLQEVREKHHWEGELRQRRRDGKEIVASTGWTMQGVGAGASLLQLSIDVKDRVESLEALRQSEERYRSFVEEDLTGNVMLRPDGSIITCNPAFAGIFGFDSVTEAGRANFLSLLQLKEEGDELMAGLRPHESVECHELEMRQRDGETVYVAAKFLGTFDHRGTLQEVKGYLFDDTRRKRLEQQLIQAQKMDVLGTLAGGIAHDFNNILSVILNHAARLENWKEHPGQMPEAVKVIRDAVARGAALVEQLLTTAHQTGSRFAPLNLNILAQEIERMLLATFPRTIELTLELHPGLPLAKADRNQIHQVLLNLCLNARDAMPNGGRVTIYTGVISRDELGEIFNDVTAESYVFVRVSDTGKGMSGGVKSRIFDPFYTTKERGKGTGLGLSVVYGVVQNHRGFVQVESEPGEGATFTIYMPLAGATDATSTPGSEGGPGYDSNRTVMLVEDEEMLRELGVALLEGDGYKVLAAKDGVEAVEMFESHAEEIGLVICDLGLPRLGGREVFLRMKEIKPGVRVIVASGYLEPNLRTEILRAGVIDTVQKPYDFRELMERVHSIVGQPQSEEDHQPQLL